MFRGKNALLKDVFYQILLGIHSVFFIYFLFLSELSFWVIVNIVSISILIGFAFYSFLTSKFYFHYFYISIVINSIPLIFKIPVSGILTVIELIAIATLVYRGLTKGENYIKTYEAGLANIPTHLTAIKVGPKNTRTINDAEHLNTPHIHVSIIIINLILTILIYLATIISI